MPYPFSVQGPAHGVGTPSFSAASVRSGSVNCYVCANNSAAYSNLAARAASLGSRLASYDARAAAGTTSRTVYASLCAERDSLRAEVNSYNQDASAFAARSPVPPSMTPKI